MRVPNLTRRQRIEVARVSGTVERLMAQGGEMTVSEAVAVVHEASRDQLVLADVLGAYTVRAETDPGFTVIVEVLRAAGADEQRTERVVAWQRWRLERAAQAEGRPIL